MPDGYNDNSALAAATAQSINQLSGYMAASNLNKKTQRFSREMYEKQKADNIAFWNMQNEYNSPAKTMERLKAAGINPNMPFQGGGNASGGIAGQISTPGKPDWNPSLPSTDLGSPVKAYQDAQLRDAQLQNLATENAVMRSTALRNLATIPGIEANTTGKQLDNAIRKEINDLGLYTSIKQAELDKVLGSISYTSNEDIRRTVMQEKNIEMMAQKILDMKEIRDKLRPEQINYLKEQINLMKQQGRLRSWDEYIQSVGGNRNGMKLWNALIQIIAGANGDGFAPPKK